ncbi:hypothetical protein [Pseudomonas laurylsulfatiphila]
MKRLVLSLCLLAVVALASVHGTGMVKTVALTAADARDIGYLNVRNNLGVESMVNRQKMLYAELNEHQRHKHTMPSWLGWARTAADGRSPWPGRDAVVAAGWRLPDR